MQQNNKNAVGGAPSKKRTVKQMTQPAKNSKAPPSKPSSKKDIAANKRAKLNASMEESKSDQQREDANWDDPGLPASQMFHLQEQEFLGEFMDLTKSKEQQKFAENWIDDRYVTERGKALDIWI